MLKKFLFSIGDSIQNLTKRKNQKFIILGTILLLVVWISGRNTCNNNMKIRASDIVIKQIESNYLDYGDYTIDEKLEKTILYNKDEYRYIFYEFYAENISRNTEIIFVDLQPIFSSEMTKNVIYYDKANDVPTSAVLDLYPQKTKTYSREILVKRNGLTNDDLKKLARTDKFKVGYSTNRWYSLFGILRSKKVIDFTVI